MKKKYKIYLERGFKKITYEEFKKYFLECNDIDLVENTYEYYNEYIYYDTNGIFDCFINKGLLANNISNLILGKGYISFKDIMEEKSIYENLDLFENTLMYLILQLKRKNLKVRIIKNNQYIEYNFKNINNFLDDFNKKYLESKNKNDFLEFDVYIYLYDSE